MRLTVDGNPYKRGYAKSVERVLSVCDSLKYGEAISTKALATRLGLGKETNPIQPINLRPEEMEAINLRRTTLKYHLSVWAHPDTIRDIKNGTIEF
jgi:hypothetical protein